jgi:hypothetical protein
MPLFVKLQIISKITVNIIASPEGVKQSHTKLIVQTKFGIASAGGAPPSQSRKSVS